MTQSWIFCHVLSIWLSSLYALSLALQFYYQISYAAQGSKYSSYALLLGWYTRYLNYFETAFLESSSCTSVALDCCCDWELVLDQLILPCSEKFFLKNVWCGYRIVGYHWMRQSSDPLPGAHQGLQPLAESLFWCWLCFEIITPAWHIRSCRIYWSLHNLLGEIDTFFPDLDHLG